MKNFEKRLTMVLGFVLIMNFIGLETMYYQRVKEHVQNDALFVAKQIGGVLMATRRVYQQRFLKSAVPLTPETLGFLPAHALARISKEFSNWSDSGITFNNVSDNPRNPNNTANAHELEDLEYFRAHPQEPFHLTEQVGVNGESVFHYTRPIWIEEYCLKCHGKKVDAPYTIRSIYDTGFDYQVGELHSLMSITIPNAGRQYSYFLKDMVIHLVGFILIFLVLLFAIHYMLKDNYE